MLPLANSAGVFFIPTQCMGPDLDDRAPDYRWRQIRKRECLVSAFTLCRIEGTTSRLVRQVPLVKNLQQHVALACERQILGDAARFLFTQSQNLFVDILHFLSNLSVPHPIYRVSKILPI